MRRFGVSLAILAVVCATASQAGAQTFTIVTAPQQPPVSVSAPAPVALPSYRVPNRPGSVGMPGAFGQEADSVDITNVKQRAYTTSAGTFALNGLTMQLVPGTAECFPDTDIP